MTAVSRTAPASEMNVTPMLDVLLVLLIIFMAASMRIRPAADVQLPEECAGACPGNSTPIVLEVLPGPTYRINLAPVAPAELGTRLRSIYAQRPEKVLYVGGHPRVRYEEVIRAMDVAKGAGVVALGLAPASMLRR